MMTSSIQPCKSWKGEAIRALELTKRYGDLVAVDHVSLDVNPGEIFGFLGPNGAGKTTTVRMLTGLTQPTGGQAFIQGQSVARNPIWVKERLGTVPETSNLYGELSAAQNLLFMAQLYGVPKRQRMPRILELLEQFGLRDRANTPFQRLSRGLKRRLTIAASLVHQPQVLFLDEPTTGLDVMSARSLRTLIADLGAQGCTVFLTTHYIAEAGQLCDRIGIIVEGRIKVVGSPAELQQTAQERPVLDVAFSSLHEDLLPQIEALPGLEQVRLANGKLRIHTKNLTRALAEISAFAAGKDLEILAANTTLPSLEDAFVTLTGISPETMGTRKPTPRGSA
jgi:ABC-2 type transport system ATP-binding protein